LNITVVAPIPSASASIVTAAKRRSFHKLRPAYRRSRKKSSTWFSIRASRQSCFTCSSPPKASCARRRASTSSKPLAMKSLTRCSRWKRSSASSRFSVSRLRNKRRTQPMTLLLLCCLQNKCYCLRKPLPIHHLCSKAPSPCPRQRVDLYFPPAVCLLPLGLQPSAVFQPVHRRIQRPFRNLKEILRDLLQPLRNGVSVDRAQSHDCQDQHIQRALQDFRFFFCHSIPRCSMLIHRTSICQVFSLIPKYFFALPPF